MLKLKYILNDLIDHAYKGDPKLPQYKRFYVEYQKKRLKTRNGDYREDNHHLRIFTEGREDVQIIKTSIHELSHHVDCMQRGKSCHDAAFYGIYERLLFAALDMGLFDMDAYRRCLKDSSDSSKVVSFSEIESPSLLFRRGRSSLLRKRKSNLIRIQQARHPSRRMRWWRPAS